LLANCAVSYYKLGRTKIKPAFSMNPNNRTTVDLAAPQPTTATLLIIDVVESVRLMEANEQDAVRQWQRLVELVVHDVLPEHAGRLVKSLGDGLMLEFATARPAVHAALHIQQLCHATNHGVAPQKRMQLRAGIHTGTYVKDAHDIYGADVNLAVRLTTLAGPGETIVSAPVRDQLTPVLDGDIEDLGDCYMKHLATPVRAYRVGDAGAAPVIEPGSSRPLDLRPTIAVIPFAARGAEPGHALIGEAVADELIAALSKTAELHVISRLSTTVFRERTASADGALADIRQHLGATFVLSGRCTVFGSHMTLFVELAEADGGRIVWAENLKGSVAGLFNPDDDMLSRIVSAVSSAVMRHELQRAQNQALPTLEGYTILLGAIAMMHRTDHHDFDKAKLMLEHLIERSKRHPVPHAWLATWHVLRAAQGWSQDPVEESKRALKCTQQALDSEPTCSLALAVDGLVHSYLLRDFDTATQRNEAALSANPNESLAWLFKGTLLSFKGNGNGALDAADRALKLSPLDPMRYFYDSLAATAALSDANYIRAIELAKRSLRANKMHTSTYRALVLAQALSGQIEEAKGTLTLLRPLDPGLTITSFLKRYPGQDETQKSLYASAFRAAGLSES
jgi:adenylate cyclase